MNNTITKLNNGDFRVNPYKFDNDQILQDSVTPDMPEVPPVTQVTDTPRFKVSYLDNFIKMQRSRKFFSLEEALQFISFRAQNIGLYNNFLLEILE